MLGGMEIAHQTLQKVVFSLILVNLLMWHFAKE